MRRWLEPRFIFVCFLSGLIWGGSALAKNNRGVLGDLTADIVLGQHDFRQITLNHADNKSVLNPRCAVVDNSSSDQPRLYIADTLNNRIIGFDDTNEFTPNHFPNQTGWDADFVIGQPDFNSTGSNGDSTCEDSTAAVPFICTSPTERTLSLVVQGVYSPGETNLFINMAVDRIGNLYVPDYLNNRVLRYNRSNIITHPMGPAADAIWGQSDFYSRQANRGYGRAAMANDRVYFNDFYSEDPMGAGVGVDGQGNLWVADRGNGRVLRFPNMDPAGNPTTVLSESHYPSSHADVVLGQDVFNTKVTITSDTLRSDYEHLQYPVAVRVDSDGRVFVLDSRVGEGSDKYYGVLFVYVPMPGLDAYGRFQYQNGASPATHLSDYLIQPHGLELDAPATYGTGGIWILDKHLQQLLLFVEDSPSTLKFEAKKVLLRDVPVATWTPVAPGVVGDDPTSNIFQDQNGFQISAWGLLVGDYDGSPGVDWKGNVYFPCNRYNDVARFPRPIPGFTPGIAHSADAMLFKQIGMGQMNSQTTLSFSGADVGLAIGVGSRSGLPVSQLLVSTRNKILFWDLPPEGIRAVTTATEPTGYASFVPVTFISEEMFQRIATDSQSHLWALTREETTGLVVSAIRRFDLPLSGGEPGTQVVGMNLKTVSGEVINDWSNFTTVKNPWGFDKNGIAVEEREGRVYLWVTDKKGNRVFRIRDPLTADPRVDIILGQSNAYSMTANQPDAVPSALNLAGPGAVAFDHSNNLYVSDYSLEQDGNGRLLRYDGRAFDWTGNTVLYPGTLNNGYVVAATQVYGMGGNLGVNVESNGGDCPRIFSDCRPWGVAFNKSDTLMAMGRDGQNGGHKYPALLTDFLNGDHPLANLDDMGAQPYSTLFDDDDNLYVIDQNWHRLMVYFGVTASSIPPTPTGTPTPNPACACPSRILGYQPGMGGNGGAAIAVGHDMVFVPQMDSTTYIGYRIGSPLSSVTCVTGLALRGIAYWEDGGNPCVFAVGAGGSRVEKWSVSGSFTQAPLNLVPAPPKDASAVVVDAHNDLWLACQDIIVRYSSPDGTNFTAGQTITVPGSSTPHVMGLLRLGDDLYVAEPMNRVVLKYTKDQGSGLYGYVSTVWTDSRSPITAMRQMAVEPGTNRGYGAEYNGNLYIFEMTDRCPSGAVTWTELRFCPIGVRPSGWTGLIQTENGSDGYVLNGIG